MKLKKILEKQALLTYLIGWVLLSCVSTVSAQTCLEVRYHADEGRNTCSCVWDNSDPEAINSYDVGVLHMTDSSSFTDIYDGVAQSLLVGEYFPIAGDVLSSNDSVQSETTFTSHKEWIHSKTTYAYYPPIVDNLNQVTESRLHYQRYELVDQFGKTQVSNIIAPMNSTALIPFQIYLFKNPTEENEYFSCETDELGFFTSANPELLYPEIDSDLSDNTNNETSLHSGYSCNNVTYHSPAKDEFFPANVCSCEFTADDDKTDIYDVGLLFGAQERSTDNAFDNIVYILYGEYSPVAGDIYPQFWVEDNITPRQQFERYNEQGEIIEVITHQPPIVSNLFLYELDPKTSRVQTQKYDQDGNITEDNIHPIASLALDPNSTYIFKAPSENNEFFSCDTNENGHFISGYGPFNLLAKGEERACVDVNYGSPALSDVYTNANICGCVWEDVAEDVRLFSYEAGIVRNVGQFDFSDIPYYDGLEFPLNEYVPVSGDYAHYDFTVRSKRQFERYNEDGELIETLDYSDTVGSLLLDPNSTYIFKNPLKENQFFSCNTNDDGHFISANEPFTITAEDDNSENNNSGSGDDSSENNGSDLENDNSENDDLDSEGENDDSSSSNTETKKPIKVPPPQPDYYLLSVTGSQAHIRSTPSGIDCGYGSGTCKKRFPRGTTVKLKAVEISTSEGLSRNDYVVEWTGNDRGCKTQTVNMTDHINCMVKVYGKQKVENTDSTNTSTENDTHTVAANSLQLVNFSGHSVLPGGSKNVVLGFVLKGEGSANLTLHADILEQGVVPELQLSEVLTNHQGIYGKLLQRQQQSNNFSFKQTANAGMYTILMNSAEGSGRGMAGVSVGNTTLDMTSISVRGYLKDALVMNFIVSGQGTQKAKLNTRILSGQVSTELHLINLSTQQGVTGQAVADGTEIELTEGVYAVILNVLEGEGVGMIDVNLAP